VCGVPHSPRINGFFRPNSFISSAYCVKTKLPIPPNCGPREMLMHHASRFLSWPDFSPSLMAGQLFCGVKSSLVAVVRNGFSPWLRPAAPATSINFPKLVQNCRLWVTPPKI